MTLGRFAVVLTLLLTLAVPPAGAVDLIATGSIPFDATDGTSFSPAILTPPGAPAGTGTPHNRVGGLGSAIAYTGSGNRYVMTPDRGPADGTVPYVDRVYYVDLPATLGSPAPTTFTPVLQATRALTSESGVNFLGLSSAFDATNSPASQRLDPEGIRVSGYGTFFGSDEYGPFINEFAPSGRRLRSIPVPVKFLIEHPNADGALELPPGNTSGRQSNRGMEGLAISPDGKTLFGLMQSPLIQDGALNASNQRRGINVRLLALDLASFATHEYLYQLDDRSLGLNEILAVNDHQFLVIERDGNGAATAAFKKIMLIDIAGATDITDIALPQTGTPAGVTPVSKSVFIDLLDPAFGLSGANFPEKIEGLAFGPQLPDGRHLLIVASDNDFGLGIPTNAPSSFYAFAIEPHELPGFEPQTMSPKLGPFLPGNVINLKSKGLLTVPVLGNPLFDPTDIDPSSVSLAGPDEVKPRRGKAFCFAFDINLDGIRDLVCEIPLNALDLKPGDTTAVLRGLTFGGTPVRSEDRVLVIKQ